MRDYLELVIKNNFLESQNVQLLLNLQLQARTIIDLKNMIAKQQKFIEDNEMGGGGAHSNSINPIATSLLAVDRTMPNFASQKQQLEMLLAETGEGDGDNDGDLEDEPETDVNDPNDGAYESSSAGNVKAAQSRRVSQ